MTNTYSPGIAPGELIMSLDRWRRTRADQRARAGERPHVAGVVETDIALGGVVTPEGADNG